MAAADELWHHSAGAPDEATPEATATTMPVQVVPAGWWQAARSRGPWSLVHCSVAPGFDFEDFSLLADLPRADHPSGAIVELL